MVTGCDDLLVYQADVKALDEGFLSAVVCLYGKCHRYLELQPKVDMNTAVARYYKGQETFWAAATMGLVSFHSSE